MAYFAVSRSHARAILNRKVRGKDNLFKNTEMLLKVWVYQSSSAALHLECYVGYQIARYWKDLDGTGSATALLLRC